MDISSTSPTVYANFHSLTGNDWCGMSVFPTKLVAFEPDELSTIAGPLTIGYGEYKSEAGAFSTQQFNFADLPCPPHSVEVFKYPLRRISSYTAR